MVTRGQTRGAAACHLRVRAAGTRLPLSFRAQKAAQNIKCYEYLVISNCSRFEKVQPTTLFQRRN